MIAKLLYRLAGRLPARLINDGSRRYLERYYLGTLFGYRFYLHRFVGSDPDRGLHNHPWARAYSLILSGHYIERRRSGDSVVRWFNRLDVDSFHRVILPAGGRPCWTLFAHRNEYVADWGFLRAGLFHSQGGYEEITIYHPHKPKTDEQSGKTAWWNYAPSGRDSDRLPMLRGE